MNPTSRSAYGCRRHRSATRSRGARGTGTILNDDVATAPLGVSVGDASIMVAMNGNHLLSFPVTLSHTVSSTVTVHFTFSHSTANYGVDYTGTKTGTVTIRPGSRQGTASITVLASSTITQTRALIVTLSSLHTPAGSRLVHSVGTGTLMHPGLLTGRLASATRRRVILTVRSSSVRRGEHNVASDEQRVTELCDDLLAKHDPEGHAAGRVPRRAVRPRARVGALPGRLRWPRPVAEAAEHDQRQAVRARARPIPYGRNPIGYGMCAPTIVTHGSDAQKQRYLRPLFTGEEIWCQMFSEPGAGSDVAGLVDACRSATATSGSSTARRCGRRSRTSRVRHRARAHRSRAGRSTRA